MKDKQAGINVDRNKWILINRWAVRNYTARHCFGAGGRGERSGCRTRWTCTSSHEVGHGFDSHEHVVLNTGRYRAVKFKRLYLNAWEIFMAVPYTSHSRWKGTGRYLQHTSWTKNTTPILDYGKRASHVENCSPGGKYCTITRGAINFMNHST